MSNIENNPINIVNHVKRRIPLYNQWLWPLSGVVTTNLKMPWQSHTNPSKQYNVIFMTFVDSDASDNSDLPSGIDSIFRNFIPVE